MPDVIIIPATGELQFIKEGAQSPQVHKIMLAEAGGLTTDTPFSASAGMFSPNMMRSDGNNTFTGTTTFSGPTIINGNLSVFGSTNVFSASNVYLSSSVLTVEDNIITLNAFAPFLRYAGIEMYDSGSGTLSQFLWDGQNDYFFLSGSGVNGKILTGPDNQGNLTSGQITKATGNNILGNSIITDNGSIVTVGGQLVVDNSSPATVLRLKSAGSTIWSLGVGDNAGSYFNISADFGSFTINKTNGTVSSSAFVASSTITANSFTGAGTGLIGTASGLSVGGSAGTVTGTNGQILRKDVRTIAPNNIADGYLQFGFTSWTNNNSSPWADYLHLRSYTDATGGNDNLVMFRKDVLGMRIWQQSYGSSTAYASYKDVCWTDGTNAINGSSWNITSSWATNAVTAANVNNGTLTIAGGTGIGVGTTSTFTANQSSNATITLSNTGVTSNVAGTGISVSGATGAVTITNSGVTSLTGTANQVSVSAASGGVTLSLPQDIHTGAGPTFSFVTPTSGFIKSDNIIGLLTTAGAAQKLRTGGILVGQSYDAGPNNNEIRTTLNTSLTINARGTGDLILQTADNQKAVLLNNGSFAIGSSTALTTGGTAALTIGGTYVFTIGASNTDLMYTRRLSAGIYQLQTYNAVGNAGEIHLEPYGGSVGIGTTSPSSKLTVVGTVATSSVLSVQGTSGTLFNVIDDLSDSLMSVNNSAGLPVLEVFADDRVVMGQYNTNDFVLRNNKVGIGTKNPSTKLEITGGLIAGGVNNGSVIFYRDTNPVTIGNTDSVLYVSDRSSNDWGITVDKTGFDYGLRINVANGSTYAFAIYDGSSYNARIYGTGGGYFSGNIGIGTSSPGQSLSIQGQIAKYTTTGIDGTFDNFIKYGAAGDLNSSGTNTNRWIGFDASITAGAAISNVLRVRSFAGGANNNAPVNIADFRGDLSTVFYGNISAANLSGTNTGDQTIGNGTITIAAGTGIGVGTTNTFTMNQSGATTVTITNSGVTSNVAGTGISVSGATGAVTITNSGVTSLAGTANQITVSAATGGVTLSLPQNIHTGASPTFATVTANLSGNATTATTANALNTANNYQVKNLTVSEKIALGNRNAIYSLWHGGNQDLAWKKIADITLPNALYACASFRVDVLDAEGNFGWSVNCRPMTYFVACRRSGGTLNSYDDAVVSGPINDYVRAFKTAQGVYELQIRQIQDWQILIFQVELITSSGTITYATGVPGNGSTTGTAYTVTTDGYTQYLPKVSATLFTGPGTGLTGTASGLSIGGNAATATTATTSTNANAISFTEVELNAPVTVSGTWTTGNGSAWGEPKFGTSFNQYRYADGNGPYVEYNIPANHHACFISQLQWDTGGYADCHGVQADGDLVFLRRINTRQLVENSNHGNTDQHDGATVTFAGSGLQAFSKIRITNRSGRIHLTGIAFTRQIDDGYEGTGMVHPAQISHQGAGSGLDADLLDGYSSATANTANTIVLRDGSGNFSAGTITANLTGNVTGNVSGTAGGETLGTVTGRGGSTGTQIIVATAAGQAMYIGRQAGAGYAYGGGGIFTALSDNPNGSSNAFYQGYISSSASTPGGILTYSVRADGQIYTTMNTATGIANNSFNVAKTILGTIHIANGSGTSGNNNQAAITFQGGSSTEAQAGIYVSNNSSTGTAMGFATTDSYATGPQLFMTATNAGVVNFPRARPTYAGNVLLDASNNAFAANMNQNVRTTDNVTFATTTTAVLSATTRIYINGQTTNTESFYQWESATYRNPGDHTPQLLIRKDNASTGINGSAPALALYNANGGAQTTVALSFVSAEAATAVGNSVALAGIVAKKESAGTNGGWSQGSLNFYVKDFGTRRDVMTLDTAGKVYISASGAWNDTRAQFTVGSGGDGRIQVRHIWGKSAASDATDHLWLQYSNASQHVQIGASGGGNNLYVAGDIYAGGYFAGNLVLTANFDNVGTIRPRTAVTTYRDHATNAPSDAAIRSLTNSDDNWIYLDSANAQWGIYHRNIDSALAVSGEQTLPANSIAFIGNNSNKAYICLADGTAYFAGTIQTGKYATIPINGLGASATQARTFEIARIGIDYNDWNNIGTFEVELHEQYYARGLKKVYNIWYGYVSNSGIRLVEWRGSGENNFQCRIGSQVQISGDSYYLPVYVDVRNYGYVDVVIKTNRTITTNSSPPIGFTYVNTAPSATNISDFTADSDLEISTLGSAKLGGNTILTTATTSATGLSIGGNAATATTLQTARTINGTSFNGSAAITTATWGTARTLTIGSTGKSVDGSVAITWSLAEIGAAATNQTMFIGTTSVAINRSSASQTLTGVSIDGNAATATTSTQLGGVAAASYVRNDVDGTDSTALFRLKTITKSLTLTTSWQDTGISSTDLATGIYILSLYVENFSVGGGHYYETYGGTMSWYADSTNSTDYDEIPLHKSGHAPNGRYVNLRTLRGASGVLKLQIISSVGTSGAINYVFKFRRMI